VKLTEDYIQKKINTFISEKRAPEIESDARRFCPKCGSGYTYVIEICPKCGSGYTQVIEKSVDCYEPLLPKSNRIEDLHKAKQDEIMALKDLKGRIEAFRNNTSSFRNDIRPILFKLWDKIRHKHVLELRRSKKEPHVKLVNDLLSIIETSIISLQTGQYCNREPAPREEVLINLGKIGKLYKKEFRKLKSVNYGFTEKAINDCLFFSEELVKMTKKLRS